MIELAGLHGLSIQDGVDRVGDKARLRLTALAFAMRDRLRRLRAFGAWIDVETRKAYRIAPCA